MMYCRAAADRRLLSRCRNSSCSATREDGDKDHGQCHLWGVLPPDVDCRAGGCYLVIRRVAGMQKSSVRWWTELADCATWLHLVVLRQCGVMKPAGQWA